MNLSIRSIFAKRLKHLFSGETGTLPTSLLPSKNNESSDDVSSNVVFSSPARRIHIRLPRGFPLAAVAGSARYMAEFDATQSNSPLIQIGTLSGNPMAAAAGLAAIRVLKQPGAYERLHATGKAIGAALKSAATDRGIAAHIVGEGPAFDLVFADEPPKNYAEVLAADSQLAARFMKGLRSHGVLKDAKFYVSTAHDEADVEATAVAAAKALVNADE